MPITIKDINNITQQCRNFIKIAEKARKRMQTEGEYLGLAGCKETAAAKRASMDLSRKLTEFRKFKY